MPSGGRALSGRACGHRRRRSLALPSIRGSYENTRNDTHLRPTYVHDGDIPGGGGVMVHIYRQPRMSIEHECSGGIWYELHMLCS